MFFSPFGDMPGHGGAPQRKPVDNTKLYEILGVEKDATQAQIKKAFRKGAMKHHPDKGGDPEMFKQMSKAYEILSDPEKRELYDQYGEDGVNGDAGPGGGPSDIFEAFFGGGGGRGRGRGRRSKRKGDDVVFPLKVTLEDLYNGTTKKLRLTKNVICKGCNGKGAKDDSVQTTCSACKGHGVKVVVRQLGPGMIQQMQTFCNDCNGQGTVIAEKDRCKKCAGAKVTKEKKTLEVFINKGMKHGEKITFRQEADEAPDTEPGDVVVVLKQAEHSVFRREGPHLFMRKRITLLEALTGFEFPIVHLDERVLLVKSGKNTVYKPGDVMAIKDEGMPQHKNPFVRGNLYVEFQIEFPKPDDLPTNVKKLLKKMLPAPEQKDMDTLPEEYEEVQLVEVDIKAERAKFAQQQKEAYDEDDDMEHRGPACRQA